MQVCSCSNFNFESSLQTMPDLANLSTSDSLAVAHCPNLKSLSVTDPQEQSCSVKTLGVDGDWERRMGFATLPNGNGAGSSNCKSLEEHVRDWVCRRLELGISKSRSSLPFLYGAKKLVHLSCLVLFLFRAFRWENRGRGVRDWLYLASSVLNR